MDVILLKNMTNLGKLGEKVSVKAGYGRNFLIPQHKAIPATQENIAVFAERRAELQRDADEELAAAKARADKIGSLDIILTAKSGEEGKLFGSITVRDIVAAVTAHDIEIEKHEIKMVDGPIRKLGEFKITVQLHAEVTTHLKVAVIAEI